MTDFPAQLPSQRQHIPKEVIDFLKEMVWKRQLELQGGEYGIIQWIYRGIARPGMTARIPFDAPAYHYWPSLKQDAKEWSDKQKAKAEGSPTPDTP